MNRVQYPHRMVATVVVVVWLVCSAVWGQADRTLRFDVRLAPSVHPPAARGRLFVFLSQREQGEPVQGPNWFSPEPFFAVDVVDFTAGQTRTVDASARGYPGSLSELPPGKYRVQALFDQDFYFAAPAAGAGNVYSQVRSVELDPKTSGAISLELTQEVPEPTFVDTRWLKIVSHRSELLSKFHDREVIDRVAVVLPASYYEQPERRYPVYYEVSGFGGSLVAMAAKSGQAPSLAQDGEVEFIRVRLTGECKWGHHVYANSATNGPRGDALVHEMIPAIDQQFRTVADSRARFVGGHSSGGWSSLWLQVQYPESFGGVWSTSPDPVDFRDWQGTNLYEDPPPSVFTDGQGQRRPLARRGADPVIWYDSFCRMDDVLGRGGQLRSFEAVFSPRGEDGEPLRCWDRSTGRVDSQVLEYWKQYDISLYIQNNWPRLREPLAGKLHVWNGGLDTFYLEGATRLLGERLKNLGSDARVEIVPGMDHGSILTPALQAQIKSEMAAAFLKYFQLDGTPR